MSVDESCLEFQEGVIKLVGAVYRVANLINQNGEAVLALEIKQQAVLVYKLLVVGKKQPAASIEIDILSTLFDLAAYQQLIDVRNFEVLKREFNILRQSLSDTTDVKKVIDKQSKQKRSIRQKLDTGRGVSLNGPKNLFNDRQTKLVRVIKDKKEVSISDLAGMFKGQVSERTVRRDLINLEKRGLIKRRGAKRWTRYYL